MGFDNLTILGIGTDIENVNRFKDINPIEHKVFLNKVFTSEELDYCFSKNQAASYLAERYSAKEAVVKAFGCLGVSNINYQDIEIINCENGLPIVNYKNELAPMFRINLSLSHCKDTVVAFATVMEVSKNATA